MHLGMSLRMEQVMKCVICMQPMNKHGSDCPQGIMEALYQVHGPIQCPKCRKQRLYRNRLDFYECADCKKVYSTGIACGYDVDKLETVILHPRIGDDTMAVVLPEDGNGDIPIMDRFEELASDIDRERKIYEMTKFIRYQLIRTEMMAVRELNKGKETPREERLLAMMDDAWQELSDEQQKELDKQK